MVIKFFINCWVAILILSTFGFIKSEELLAEDKQVFDSDSRDREEVIISAEEQKLNSPQTVYVIPVKGQIGKPTLFILRRGLKEAIEKKVDVIVLDINTPGGGLDVTVDIMKALSNFEGNTLAYVNDEAISAGAYISVATDSIYFAPQAIIGAAAVIQGTGQDLDSALKSKVDSYMRGNIARFSGDHPYRAKVMRAMMDEDYELIIDDNVISPKGELLTLWTEEAMTLYGEPPIPLLGAGVAESVESLLEDLYGASNYSKKRLEVTWSEYLAQIVSPLIPLVIGIGMIGLFIEFKTPGFGFFGIAGITLLVGAFLSNYIAGLAGNEPLLLFFLGIVLIGLEVFLFPGLIVTGVLGFCFVLAALLWSMADVWPSVKDGAPQLSLSLFIKPIYNLLLALIIAVVGIVISLKFLPKTPFYKNFVLETSSAQQAEAQVSGAPAESQWPEAGAQGVAITSIHPGGEIEIDGKRYEALSRRESIAAGDKIVVIGRSDFSVVIDKV